jgi:hypothetical protein
VTLASRRSARLGTVSSISSPGRVSGSGLAHSGSTYPVANTTLDEPTGECERCGLSGSLIRSYVSPRRISSWYSTREPSGSSSTTDHRSTPRSRRSGSGSGRTGDPVPYPDLVGLAAEQERAVPALDDRHRVRCRKRSTVAVSERARSLSRLIASRRVGAVTTAGRPGR